MQRFGQEFQPLYTMSYQIMNMQQTVFFNVWKPSYESVILFWLFLYQIYLNVLNLFGLNAVEHLAMVTDYLDMASVM